MGLGELNNLIYILTPASMPNTARICFGEILIPHG